MSEQRAMVESLEGRNLLSVVPMLAYGHVQPVDSGKVAAITVTKAAAKAKPKATRVPPSVEGDWDGRLTIKAFPFKVKYDLQMNFSDITKTSASGTVTIDDRDYSGKWTGHVDAKHGYFSYTLKKHGDKVKIVGTLGPKSNYAWGTIQVDWGFRVYKGDFTANKF